MVDLDDDQPEMDFNHYGPCTTNWPLCFRWEIGAILEILPMYLSLAMRRKKKDNCVLNGVETYYAWFMNTMTIYTYNTCILLWQPFYHAVVLQQVPNINMIERDLLHFCTSQLHWVRSLLGCCSRCIWNVRRVKYVILIIESPTKVFHSFWIKTEPSFMAKCIVIG